MHKHLLALWSIALLPGLLISGNSPAADWVPVKDAEILRALFSDTVMTATLKDDTQASSRYNSDGSGELSAWGAKFERQWKVEDGGACLLIDQRWRCFDIEQDSASENSYRGTVRDTGEQIVFQVSGKKIESEGAETSGAGGAVAPSADEIAKELANPNTPLANVSLKIKHTSFEGDISGADDQDQTEIKFQPSLPFPLENGDLIIFRPLIQATIDKPMFDPAESDNFSEDSGFGDFGYDLVYGTVNKETGGVTAFGVVGAIPIGEDDFTTDRWTLGPSTLLGKISKTRVYGLFARHQWDFAGSGDADISITNLQPIYVHLPGGGWSITTAPDMVYDHETEDWTIPVNLSTSKTTIINGRPWQFAVEADYFVEQPDEFGPDWSVQFTVTPVMENIFARWFK